MPNVRCSACGAAAANEILVPVEIKHNGKSRIINDRQTVCVQCQNVSYIGDQIDAHEFAVASAIREIEGLLSAEELQRVRAKYRFKQTDMEQMLSTGPKTWTRWERGKVPQNKSADKLIRLMAERPEVAWDLMKQSGVRNDEANAVFEQIAENAKTLAQALFQSELGDQVTGHSDMRTFVDKAFATVKNAWKQAAEAA